MWQTLIDKKSVPGLAGLLDRVHQAVLDYSRQDLGNGLMVGKMGTIIYLSYLKKIEQTNEYDELIEDLLVNSLAETDYRVSSSFCSGLSGTLWGIQYLKSNNLVELDEEFSEYGQYLREQVILDLKSNNLDYLYGPVGSMLYLLDADPAAFEEVKDTFLDKLREAGEESDGEIKWKTVINSPRLHNQEGYNLSMAHGTSSIISLLCAMLEKEPGNAAAKGLLLKSVRHILQTKKPVPDPSYFPAYILTNEDPMLESRLAWCYGDMGTCYALYKAGISLGHKALCAQALDVLLHSTTRLDYNDNRVNDACICHGSSGVAHIYNRIYHHTGRPEFKEASLHWLGETIRFGDKDPGSCGGYEFYNGVKRAYQENHSMLEGLTGVALVLRAATSHVEPTWDRCIFLS